MSKDIFKKIAVVSDNIAISKVANELSERFNILDCITLQKCIRMAYVLYLLEHTDIALQITSTVENIAFTDNYNTWTWIEHLLVLKSRIECINGNMSFRNKLQTVIAPAILNTGDDLQQKINRSVFDRMLRGEGLLKDAEIEVQQAIENNNIIDEFYNRFMYNLYLCELSEYGGSETFPVVKAESLILSNQVRLKYLLIAMMSNHEQIFDDFLNLK